MTEEYNPLAGQFGAQQADLRECITRGCHGWQHLLSARSCALEQERCTCCKPKGGRVPAGLVDELCCSHLPPPSWSSQA